MTALENDDPETAELLESLSAQMRYVISDDHQEVPLERELTNIMDYFTIIRVRYKGRISVIVNIADEDRKIYVPKLLLQPLVENAIKHGLKEKEGNGHVILELNRSGDTVEITVMDDGLGVPKDQVNYIQTFLEESESGDRDPQGHVGIGMKNISDRIKLDYGDAYGLDFESYIGMGTIVKVRLPYMEEEKHVESNTGR